MARCGVCLSVDGFALKREPASQHPRVYFDCPVCGMFGVSQYDIDDYLGDDRNTKPRVRAALSYWLRRQTEPEIDTLILPSETVLDAVHGRLTLPSPSQVATNIVKFIGEHIQRTGERLEELPPDFHPKVGAVSRRAAVDLVMELESRNLVKATESDLINYWSALDLDLTLSGWERFDAEVRGKTSGGYGFIALKFGDAVLDPLVKDHIKPAMAEIGFEVRDMRDVARAGIIDNLMRQEIRDADFVLVDLTHENAGAYWEAGYAEGLGKPVLYICESGKFEEARTHFDTNHCTTVLWKKDDPERFKTDLVATLRRSLQI